MLTEVKKPSLSIDIKSYRQLKSVYVTALQGDEWGMYGSSVKEYSEFFGEDIVAIVQRIPSPVVVDLMSPAYTLEDLFLQIDSASKLGVAVTIKDRRGEESAIHHALGITQIAGDLTETDTWRELKSTLGERKADLIVERGESAWDLFPHNERYFAIMLSQLWAILSHDNGKMFLQIPSFSLMDSYGVRYGEWRDNLINSGISPEDISLTDRRLKLTKTPESPQHLPFLPPSRQI